MTDSGPVWNCPEMAQIWTPPGLFIVMLVIEIILVTRDGTVGLVERTLLAILDFD
jgi:hypothetical protein